MSKNKVKSIFKSNEGKSQILKYYDLLLNNWDFEHEEININTSYGNTFMIASGKKESPILLLLHGTGMNSAMWIKEIEIYSERYRVYAIDMPGEPGKSIDKQYALEGDIYSDWLNEILLILKIDKISIVGISLGGWSATKFSIKYPQKVEKLVLLSPAGIASEKKSFLFKSAFYFMMGEKGIYKLYYKINGNKIISQIISNYEVLIAKHFYFRKETIPIFSDDEILRLAMPICLFVGERDIIIHPKKTANRLGKLLKHAHINFLSGEGHALIKQGESIRKFLK